MTTFVKYTPEQHDVLDWMDDNDGILLVEAGPGTGKSFMSREITEQLQPRTCLYTAFNKAIVTEGISRFKGLNVSCKTMHALAYAFVKPKGEISDISYKCITEKISYKDKARIIDAINTFYVSSSTDIFFYMQEVFPFTRDKNLRDLSVKYIEKLVNQEIDPTFNFMLKYFHLCLVDGSATCNYDLVILDEINDTPAVVLEIFTLIKAPTMFGLGETNHAIYDFLNLVNGFELLEDEATVLPLTQSFRCSENIARRIQQFMREDVNPDFKFIGTDEPVRNGKSLYCTGTNASIIKEINERLHARQGFHLLRKLSEILRLPYGP